MAVRETLPHLLSSKVKIKMNYLYRSYYRASLTVIFLD